MSRSIKNKKPYRAFCIGIITIITAALVCLLYTSRAGFVTISPNDWSHFPGAEVSGNSVHIKPIGGFITHSDKSAAQPNPPVNIRGSHLIVSGDFQIKASLSGLSNGATLQLYERIPIIYDEWRQERASTSIETTSTGLKIRIWDGTSPSSIDERTFKTTLKDSEILVLSHKSGKLVVGLNNVTLGDIPDHNIFSNGGVWFGADANLGTDGFFINSLQVRGLGGGHVDIVAARSLADKKSQGDSLRNLAASNPRHLPIGAAIAVYPLFADEQYRNIALSQFSIMTPENSMKPQFLHPGKNLYIFQDADSLVEVARENHMQVHGHALVMGKANPEWMQATPKKQRQQVMVDHISTVVSHFKGKVAEWDVVNEPLSADDIDYTNGVRGLRNQMWFEAMGEGYIDTAFRAAYAADPTAKLYLNDYGLEKDGKRWDAILALVKRLRARHVPINGVGFEAHVYHSPGDIIDPRVLRQHIRTLATLGIASRISEIDILGDNPKVQAKQYSDILKVCLAEPTCTSYTTWGITDLYGSTTTADRYPTKLGKSLLWDETYKPKPALATLQNTLK